MAVFEVFIPAPDADGFDITATIEADSWMQALRSGLSKLGDPASIKNVMCDIKETGIDVTDPNSGRVFRITEQAAGAPAAPVAESGAPPAAKKGPPPAAPKAGAPVEEASVEPAEAASSDAVEAEPVAAVAESSMDTGRFSTESIIETVVRTKSTGTHNIGRSIEEIRAMEEVLEDLFTESNDIYECASVKEASEFIMNLAVKAIPAEAGAVLIADINLDGLVFSHAIGPKADAVMDYTVPMGQGFVGFCAQEGVSVAVNDAHLDGRFYREISDKIGYETRSLMCAPAQSGGRVYGALELINKVDGSSFTAEEVNVLNFLAHELSEYLVNTGQTGE